MVYELRRLENYDDTSLISEIKRVATLIEALVITKAEFDRLSKASSSTIRHRFGTWEKALSQAGLANRYSGASNAVEARARARRTFLDDELIAELRLVASKLSDAPVTIEAFKRYASINPETVRRRFGSWSKALARAGLEVSNLGKRYDESDYFENLLVVWAHYGRQPTYGEMARQPSRISAHAYEARWKTWRKALKTFIDYVNGDAPKGPSELSLIDKTAKQERSPAERRPRRAKSFANLESEGEPRTIRIGIRYKVLKRDAFRCIVCGASPATKLGCELHVDHIVPFSRGGMATFENLRTLCCDCNIGKGAQLD
jgi:5-methylcytosine-specific restriction endonuclease McrA